MVAGDGETETDVLDVAGIEAGIPSGPLFLPKSRPSPCTRNAVRSPQSLPQAEEADCESPSRPRGGGCGWRFL
jgi:hypothetical protein